MTTHAWPSSTGFRIEEIFLSLAVASFSVILSTSHLLSHVAQFPLRDPRIGLDKHYSLDSYPVFLKVPGK